MDGQFARLRELGTIREIKKHDGRNQELGENTESYSSEEEIDEEDS